MQTGTPHPLFLIYEKKKEGSCEPSELVFLADAFVRGVRVADWKKVGDHFEYEMEVYARSRFLLGLPRTECVKHRLYTRFSSLLDLNKDISVELSAHTKGKIEMPVFPSKKWFVGEETAAKRVQLLNVYFKELFQKFPTQTMFSQTILDYFSPHPIEVTLFGCSGPRLQTYMNSLTYLISHQIPHECLSISPIGEEKRKLKYYEFKAADDLPIDPTKIDKNYSWRKFIPFDYINKDILYRVDIQNLHEESHTPREMEMPHYGPLLFMLDLESEISIETFRNFLFTLSKLKTDKKELHACFTVVGLSCPETEHIINSEEIEKSLITYCGKSSPYTYVEVNPYSGKNVLASFNTLLHLIWLQKTVLAKPC